MKKLYLLFMAMCIAVLSFGQTITCPGDITVSNDPGSCDAVVNYTVTYAPGGGRTFSFWDVQFTGATEDLTWPTNTGSGRTFNLGTTLVEVHAHQDDGTWITCTFNIT